MFFNLSSNAILMFHRVSIPSHDGIICHEHLKVTPEYFEKQLKELINNQYCFVSMDEFCDLLKTRRKYKKVLTITFDDGFADNYYNALPILKSLNIPSIVYVATGLISGEYQSIWERLESIIVNENELEIDKGLIFNISTLEKKKDCFMALRQLFLCCTKQYDAFNYIFKQYLNNKTKIQISENDRMMTVDELKNWAKEPLCSVGSHTHGHISCGDFNSSEVQDDILKSLKLLREDWNIKVNHFAFPYGDPVAIPKSDVKEFFLSNNIFSAVTTNEKIINFGEDNNCYSLPRFMVSMYSSNSITNILINSQKSKNKQIIKQLIKKSLLLK